MAVATKKNEIMLFAAAWVGIEIIILSEVSQKEEDKHYISHQFSSVTQSCPTLWPHGLQQTRLPCPSPTPRVYSNSCPVSQWCHPAISSSVIPFSSHLQSFPASVFSNESALHIRWPKYWILSISLSNEYSGLISSRIPWFDLVAAQGLSREFNITVQKH